MSGEGEYDTFNKSKMSSGGIDVKKRDNVQTSIHVGPDINCISVDTIQSNNYYSCICFKCHKKVK